MASSKRRSEHGYLACNKVRLVRGGSEYFNLLVELINRAKSSIHLQVYIFNDDETGRMVAEALKQAAKRNVKVCLLADGYASQSMPHKFIDELNSAGVSFRFFEPIFKSRNLYFGRRMHHKVLVVDAIYALVGGINIADHYNDINGKKGWLDFAMYAEGAVAEGLCIICWKLWRGLPATKKSRIPCEQDSRFLKPLENEEVLVGIFRNDWVRRKNQVSRMYAHMLRNAQSHVTILSSYFLPGRMIRKQIVLAVKRGVDVKVITAGPSDVMIAKYAERWLYDWFLRNNVKLYEYQENVLHGKVAVCDDEWMTIGSYNINDISAYASVELNLAAQNASFAKHGSVVLQEIIDNDCIPIIKEEFERKKNILRQFRRWLSYQFIRSMFYLFTFYFKQQN